MDILEKSYEALWQCIKFIRFMFNECQYVVWNCEIDYKYVHAYRYLSIIYSWCVNPYLCYLFSIARMICAHIENSITSPQVCIMLMFNPLCYSRNLSWQQNFRNSNQFISYLLSCFHYIQLYLLALQGSTLSMSWLM